MVRGCMASSVVVGPVKDGRFLITVTWSKKDGTTGSHDVEFRPGNVFVSNGLVGVKMRRPVCRFADEVIQQVIKVRG